MQNNTFMLKLSLLTFQTTVCGIIALKLLLKLTVLLIITKVLNKSN